MPRLRLLDFRLSDGPKLLGICQDNQAQCAAVANRIQRRLVYAREAGEEGWWGTFAEMAFNNVSRNNPFITTPRGVARVQKFDVCNSPIPLNNPYYEYLQFGNGRMPHICPARDHWHCLTESFTRNNVVTFAEQTVFPCIIRIFTTDPADFATGPRVFLQGIDPSDNVIYSDENGEQVQGIFVTVESPFADAPIQFSQINGIQKDITKGSIHIFQVDPATGLQTLLLTMEPTETVAGYRRYYLHNLPNNCCRLPANTVPPQPVRVTAIVKLELLPVSADPDYLLLQNLEAMIEEGISARMSGMDNQAAQQLSAIHHINAVRMLNAELVHYLGKLNPAVRVSPFGSARLERQRIGTMI